MMPKRPLLETVCGPFWQFPTGTLARRMSGVAYSYLPPEPTGFHPLTLPEQSMVTSSKPFEPLTRTMENVGRHVRRIREEDVLREELRGRKDVRVVLVALPVVRP